MRRVLLCMTAVAALAVSSQVQAGCNCQSGSVAGMSIPMYAGGMVTPPVQVLAGFAFVPPPPGTLGRTYSRVSHPIPHDEHPRTAMLAVRDNGSIPLLNIHGMAGFRMKNGIWLFESNQPLVEGVEHIVRLEARRTEYDIEPYDRRFVRLIPGRLVYLDFK